MSLGALNQCTGKEEAVQRHRSKADGSPATLRRLLVQTVPCIGYGPGGRWGALILTSWWEKVSHKAQRGKDPLWGCLESQMSVGKFWTPSVTFSRQRRQTGWTGRPDVREDPVTCIFPRQASEVRGCFIVSIFTFLCAQHTLPTQDKLDTWDLNRNGHRPVQCSHCPLVCWETVCVHRRERRHQPSSACFYKHWNTPADAQLLFNAVLHKDNHFLGGMCLERIKAPFCGVWPKFFSLKWGRGRSGQVDLRTVEQA